MQSHAWTLDPRLGSSSPMPHDFEANQGYSATPSPTQPTYLFYSASTNPSFSFSALLLLAHSGGTSIPSSSSWSPCCFVLCTVVGLCSAGLYTVYRMSGVGPVLMNWCCVPAGTIMRSPALTSWSLPAMVALPLPDVKVRIWSTVCFYPVYGLAEGKEGDPRMMR